MPMEGEDIHEQPSTTTTCFNSSRDRPQQRPQEEEEQVMSDVHLGCPPHFSAPYISHFTFKRLSSFTPTSSSSGGKVGIRLDDTFEQVEAAPTCQMLTLDQEGDLVLARRKYQRDKKAINNSLTIQHKITSSIPTVGLQVWRAALVLADFVLHTIFTSANFDDIVALELGSGTGFVGILLARAARTVFLTDCGAEILDNCATNAYLNSRTFKYQKNSIRVRELDWNTSWPPVMGKFQLASNPRYAWSSSEEIEEAEGASLLLAADVIYSDELTDSLFDTLEKLMSRGSEKVLYLALERRYNFSIDDLNVVANGYSHFQKYLKDEESGRLTHGPPYFVGKQVDIGEIPQYISEYDRGKDLEIWMIEYITTKRLKLDATGS